jgi:hypothetical protein
MDIPAHGTIRQHDSNAGVLRRAPTLPLQRQHAAFRTPCRTTSRPHARAAGVYESRVGKSARVMRSVLGRRADETDAAPLEPRPSRGWSCATCRSREDEQLTHRASVARVATGRNRLLLYSPTDSPSRQPMVFRDAQRLESRARCPHCGNPGYTTWKCGRCMLGRLSFWSCVESNRFRAGQLPDRSSDERSVTGEVIPSRRGHRPAEFRDRTLARPILRRPWSLDCRRRTWRHRHRQSRQP